MQRSSPKLLSPVSSWLWCALQSATPALDTYHSSAPCTLPPRKPLSVTEWMCSAHSSLPGLLPWRWAGAWTPRPFAPVFMSWCPLQSSIVPWAGVPFLLPQIPSHHCACMSTKPCFLGPVKRLYLNYIFSEQPRWVVVFPSSTRITPISRTFKFLNICHFMLKLCVIQTYLIGRV